MCFKCKKKIDKFHELAGICRCGSKFIEQSYNIPLIKELTKQGLTLVDMHTHTRLSDGAHHYEQAIEKAKREGIGLCITDHNEIRGSLKVEGVFTLYGAEITTKELYDILLYFSSKKSLSEFYSKYLENARIKEFRFRFHKTKISTAELLDYAKDFNALTIIAHPHTYHPKKSYNFFDENKADLEEKEQIISHASIQKSGVVVFSHLKADKYRIKILEDKDNNGRWSSGNYALKRLPEKVFYFPTIIEMKAGWKVEEKWEVSYNVQENPSAAKKK